MSGGVSTSKTKQLARRIEKFILRTIIGYDRVPDKKKKTMWLSKKLLNSSINKEAMMPTSRKSGRGHVTRNFKEEAIKEGHQKDGLTVDRPQQQKHLPKSRTQTREIKNLTELQRM